jgi:hypothetical protein
MVAGMAYVIPCGIENGGAEIIRAQDMTVQNGLQASFPRDLVCSHSVFEDFWFC